jgi:fructokinase
MSGPMGEANQAGAAPYALVVGEALVDVVVAGDGSTVEHAGGSPANVAVALSRLGHRTTLATQLGDDAYGNLIAGHLAASGVELSVCGAERTSSARAWVDGAGVATYEFDFAWDPVFTPVQSPPVVVHTGSVGAVHESVVELVEGLRPTSTVSYDVNARPALMGAPADVARIVERLVVLADVVKASDEDLAWLYPLPTNQAARDLLGLGPAAVVVTRGAAGASIYLPERRIDVAAPGVRVADTIGAGDTFSAGIIHGMWAHDLLGASRRTALAGADWERIGTFAAWLAAQTTARPGANPPWAEELGSVQP